jgi:hypothetical protein
MKTGSRICLLGVLVGLLMNGRAGAASYFITAQITGATDTSFNPLPAIPDVTKNSGQPRYFTVGFTLFAVNFNAALNQRGFANMAFDINLTGNSLATSGPIPGWFSFNPIVDTNGPGQTGGNLPLWFANEDIGNPTDMKSILLDLDVIPNPHPDDPRPHVGEGAGTQIGAVVVYWDGWGAETLEVAAVVSGGQKQISFARIDNGLPQLDTSAVFAGATINFGVTPVAGDFDGDGDVDGADFVVWQTHFPQESGATLNDGDGDNDGDVDGADFVIWQTNFPFPPSPGVAPVPEPAAWILLTIGGLIALRCRR